MRRYQAAAEQQRAVGAAKAEGVAQQPAERARADSRSDSSPQLGIALAQFSPAGIRPCRSASAQMTASSAPAAPSAWPVAPLVELQGVSAAEYRADRAALGAVIARRAGAVQIDVVDVARVQPRRQPVRAASRAGAGPSGCGLDM